MERLFSDNNNNLWQLSPSRHQCAIKCSEVTFPCTRVKREISRFISEDTLSFVRQNLSRDTRAVGDIPRKHLACCEKRRETTFVSLRLYYIRWRGLTCLARAERSRSGRSVSGMNTRRGVARSSKTKRNVYEKQAISHRPQRKSRLSVQWRYRHEASLHVDNLLV